MALDTENWMKYLPADLRVIDTYIPCSHDASAYPIGNPSVDGLNDAVGAITQLAGYTAQLNAGSRYFDMRVARQEKNSRVLRMKHADFQFQTLPEVLDLLIKFADKHPSEYFFLDFDFDSGDGNLSNDIMEQLLKAFSWSEDRFSMLHVNPNKVWREDTKSWELGYTYNTDLLWFNVRRDGRQFFILWQDGVDSGRYWAPQAQYMRYNLEKSFNTTTSAKTILDFIDESLQAWTRDKLFVCQVINTPFVSPLRPPADTDKFAEEEFNNWIMSKKPGDKLGIVKRDFINAAYNRDSIAHVIKLNPFPAGSLPILPPLTKPIHYGDTIMLQTEGGKYLSVALSPDQATSLSLLELVDAPDYNCHFIIRDYDYSPTKPITYCGDLETTKQYCRGNFRLEFRRSNIDNFVLSVNKSNKDGGKDGRLYWGVSWAGADDLETFAGYDPDNLEGTGQIYSGSQVWIRNFQKPEKTWWMYIPGGVTIYAIVSTLAPQVFLLAALVLAPLLKRYVGREETKTFLMVSDDKDHFGRVYASSPDTTLAHTFTIKKVPIVAGVLPDESNLVPS